MFLPPPCFFFFFFNDTATTEIYTLSLHDALPIYLATFEQPGGLVMSPRESGGQWDFPYAWAPHQLIDRKSTRLNSSHLVISYAVFCLKKKKNHFLHSPFLTNMYRTHPQCHL